MMARIQKSPSKKLKEYEKYLKEEADKFRLTSEDLGNLFDCMFMMNTPKEIGQDFGGTLKLNNMDKWYKDFHKRIEKVVVPELYNDKEVDK